MTREEQIRQASIKYTLKNKPKFICGDMEDELNRNSAFEEGAKWADEHPINVWHDVIEPPKLGKWFLAQIGNITFDTFIMAMNKNEDWKEWSNGINIKRWAYISDLLPKGGER